MAAYLPNAAMAAILFLVAWGLIDFHHIGEIWKVSRSEVAGEKEIAKRFSRFDANKDGKLQEDEFLKAAQENDKRVLADTAITTKVKSEFLITKGIPSTAISVETYEGKVQLSGFVESQEQIAAAAKVAKAIAGVKSVLNNLKVK